jgi:hypothetical protein
MEELLISSLEEGDDVGIILGITPDLKIGRKK